MRLPTWRMEGAVRFSWCAETPQPDVGRSCGRTAALSKCRQGCGDVSARDESLYYRRSRFTTRLPRDRRYSPAHYWLFEESPGIWRVGLTKFATRMLGDIVEFELTCGARGERRAG